ncbi:MAG: NAD(P)/FAD-dependent oxidoreductase [Candidatus Cryosericum sp.]
MMVRSVDIAVLGAGPAGMAAALAAAHDGANTVLIERENHPGGILKQCVHDGFGLLRFGEKLSGPEYAGRFVHMVREAGLPVLTSTFVAEAHRDGQDNILMLVDRTGVTELHAKAVVLATGCRERSARQVMIQGTRPAGVMTAGAAQYYVNVLGYLPTTRCVILGSGDIGLIMARRLTLEGAEVLGVFEAKSTPSGLSRNIAQCLDDFGIPLHLSRTVTRIFGDDRVDAVETAAVDEKMCPIAGTEELLRCDGVILSVGLIPENEVGEALGVPMDPVTKGPVMDQNGETQVPGVFVCGNAGHVNDLVDYVTESGERAGEAAAAFVAGHRTGRLLPLVADGTALLYVVPQFVDRDVPGRTAIIYFRSREELGETLVQVAAGGETMVRHRYHHLRPPEMERLEIDLSRIPADATSLYIGTESIATAEVIS